MSTKLTTTQNFHKRKPMIVRYIILFFLLLLIVLQFIFPEISDSTENSIKNKTTRQENNASVIIEQNNTLHLFHSPVPLIGDYIVYQNIISQQYTNLSTGQIQRFKHYCDSDIAKNLDKLLKFNKIPHEFVYTPWIMSEGDSNYIDKNNALGLFAFTPSMAGKYGLEVIPGQIDERYAIEKNLEAFVIQLKKYYNTYQDWEIVAIKILDDIYYKQNILSEGNYILSEKKGDRNNMFENFYSDVYINWDLFFQFAVWKIIEEQQTWNKQIINFPTIKIKIQGGEDLLQRAYKNNIPYSIVRVLNPWILNQMLPKGNRSVIVPKR